MIRIRSRIAGVLTIVGSRQAAQIESEEMENAVALMRWYLGEAARLQAGARTDARLTRAAKMLAWLQARGRDPVDFRDILNGGPSGMRTKAEAEDALAVLINHNWVAEVSKRPRRLLAQAAMSES